MNKYYHYHIFSSYYLIYLEDYYHIGPYHYLISNNNINTNIENRKSRVLIYFGGAGVYYDRLRESVDNDFPELTFS